MRRVKGIGPLGATSFWFGHAPGWDEMQRGRPWVGRAGELLDGVFYKEGIVRDEIFLSNLRTVMPAKGDGGPYSEIDRLECDLMRVEPPVLVPMGREAVRWVLGDVDLEAVHGIPWKLPANSPYPAGLRPPVVVPIYNPAYALHDVESYTMVSWDVKQVKRVLNGEVAPREIRDRFPSARYTLGFQPYPRARRIFIDTEGFPDAPWCASYTCRPGVAHVILAGDVKGLRQLQELMDQCDEIYLHSAMWDLAVMRAMRLHVEDGKLRDTKVLTYITAIEPPGLKALCFRHAGMRMNSYDDLTEQYDFAQAFEYLEQVVEVDWGKPEPVLERKDGKPYVKRPQGLTTRVRSIFTAIAKGEVGSEDDEEEGETKWSLPRKRWFKIEPELRAAAEERFGPMPRFSLDLVPLEDAIQYAGADADGTCRIADPLDDLVTGVDREVYNTDIAALPIVERMQENGLRAKPGYFPTLSTFFQKEMDRIRKEIEEYNQGKYINPNSSQQTAVLLFDRLRLPVEKLTPGRKPSTNDKVLEALRGRHVVVGKICDWREVATLKDKFSTKLPRYIQADGRVRGKIRDTTVVSGRYSMSEPNLMAIPTRTAIGKKIRMGFIPNPGNVMCGADFDQVELRVMADLGRDEGMIKAFKDKRDVHAETASLMFGVRLEDVDPLLHRYPAKRIGFGIATGITEHGLYDQMRLAGISKYSVGDCADFIVDYFRVRPGVKRMIVESKEMARRDGYVRDKGGRIRYLPGVYSSNPRVKEEALRQSHSHRVSGTAQWIKKRALARMWVQIRDLPRNEMEPLLEIHDEVIFEVRKGREEWAEAMLMKAMSADSDKFLVPITAKVKFGENWGALKD